MPCDFADPGVKLRLGWGHNSRRFGFPSLDRDRGQDNTCYTYIRVTVMETKKAGTPEIITTKIDFAHRRIAKITNVAELAEMLFPGNRNQQYAFLVIWVRLKWRTEGIVPNLGNFVTAQGVSRRTLERVRAKMRRMGLLEHISRFDPRYGNREGWILAENCEKALATLAQKVGEFKDAQRGSQEEDERILGLALVRRDETPESED